LPTETAISQVSKLHARKSNPKDERAECFIANKCQINKANVK